MNPWKQIVITLSDLLNVPSTEALPVVVKALLDDLEQERAARRKAEQELNVALNTSRMCSDQQERFIRSLQQDLNAVTAVVRKAAQVPEALKLETSRLAPVLEDLLCNPTAERRVSALETHIKDFLEGRDTLEDLRGVLQ